MIGHAPLPRGDELAVDYVNSDGPETENSNHFHLFAESDAVLTDYLEDKRDRELEVGEFERVKAITEYWKDDNNLNWSAVSCDYEFEMRHGETGDNFPFWPLGDHDVPQKVEIAERLREHAPGVALTHLMGVFGSQVGFTFAMSTVEGYKRDERDRPDTKDLRLAITYVCANQVPPSSLVVKALAEPLPWELPDEVKDAFKRSIQLLESRVSTALANIGDGLSFKM